MNEKIGDMLMEVAKMLTQETGDVRAEIIVLCRKVSEVNSKLSDTIVDNFNYKNDILFYEVKNIMHEYIEHINDAIKNIQNKEVE